MKISFDLDDTLTGYKGPRETGQTGLLARLRYKEPLRLGTRALLCCLQDQGHRVSIYTSSFRQGTYVKKWFLSYGVRLDGVINGETNRRVIKGLPLTKNPDAFNFDLHFDDEDIVIDPAYKLRCRLCMLEPDDLTWADKVLSLVS